MCNQEDQRIPLEEAPKNHGDFTCSSIKPFLQRSSTLEDSSKSSKQDGGKKQTARHTRALTSCLSMDIITDRKSTIAGRFEISDLDLEQLDHAQTIAFRQSPSGTLLGRFQVCDIDNENEDMAKEEEKRSVHNADSLDNTPIVFLNQCSPEQSTVILSSPKGVGFYKEQKKSSKNNAPCKYPDAFDEALKISSDLHNIIKRMSLEMNSLREENEILRSKLRNLSCSSKN